MNTVLFFARSVEASDVWYGREPSPFAFPLSCLSLIGSISTEKWLSHMAAVVKSDNELRYLGLDIGLKSGEIYFHLT